SGVHVVFRSRPVRCRTQSTSQLRRAGNRRSYSERAPCFFPASALRSDRTPTTARTRMPDLDPALDLADQLYGLLQEVPGGVSEYRLLQTLRERRCSHLPSLPLSDRLVLFRSHFLLFNAL